eukprot:g24861.t1
MSRLLQELLRKDRIASGSLRDMRCSSRFDQVRHMLHLQGISLEPRVSGSITGAPQGPPEERLQTLDVSESAHSASQIFLALLAMATGVALVICYFGQDSEGNLEDGEMERDLGREARAPMFRQRSGDRSGGEHEMEEAKEIAKEPSVLLDWEDVRCKNMEIFFGSSSNLLVTAAFNFVGKRVMGFQISETMEDLWQKQGASTDMMLSNREEDRSLMENRGLITSGSCETKDFSREMTGSQSSWFEVVLLLDHYSSHCPSLAKLPVTCAVIARMVAKDVGNDDDNYPVKTNPLLDKILGSRPKSAGRAIAEGFANWMETTFNCKADDIPKHPSMIQEEMEVVKALDWKVHYPCLERWLCLYSTRFSGLIGVRSAAQFEGMKEFVRTSARAILTTNETVAQDLSWGRGSILDLKLPPTKQ